MLWYDIDDNVVLHRHQLHFQDLIFFEDFLFLLNLLLEGIYILDLLADIKMAERNSSDVKILS